MHIRDLEIGDVDNLLAFELENRAWFERFITPRPDNFYAAAAVHEHIRAHVIAKQRGRFHGCVVLGEGGQIIARANLREIILKHGLADIGYRVAKAHAGAGVATEATRHLMALAYDEWHLKQLRGFAIVSNIASCRVLEKNGFIKVGIHANSAKLRHGIFDCYEYRHEPSAAK